MEKLLTTVAKHRTALSVCDHAAHRAPSVVAMVLVLAGVPVDAACDQLEESRWVVDLTSRTHGLPTRDELSYLSNLPEFSRMSRGSQQPPAAPATQQPPAAPKRLRTKAGVEPPPQAEPSGSQASGSQQPPAAPATQQPPAAPAPDGVGGKPTRDGDGGEPMHDGDGGEVAELLKKEIEKLREKKRKLLAENADLQREVMKTAADLDDLTMEVEVTQDRREALHGARMPAIAEVCDSVKAKKYQDRCR